MADFDRLAGQAARGDQCASRELVRHTQVEIWRLAAALVDRASAEDLVQETYLRAWPQLAKLKTETAARALFATIAYRVCVDEIRRRQRERRRITRLANQPLRPTESTGFGLEQDALLGVLSTDRRAAFVLTRLLGYSYEEAATVCGVPVGTIRSRVARARGDLAGELHRAARGST
ncbi:MAG: RNA polymerase sigma factor [Acidimicrobiales bacterium]